jgi:phenylacetate-CoA ligase
MSLYAGLVRNVFFPLALWRRGETAQLYYLEEFERTQHLSADELRSLQTRRLRALLRHAYQRCPFYRRSFHNAGAHPEDVRAPEDLRALPVLEKIDIQERGSEMVAHGWPAGDLIRNQTGGSTGTPISFYLCNDRKCSRAAATLRHNRWAGWEVGDRAAVIWGAPRDKPGSALRSRLRGALLRDPLWLDTAALTEETLLAFHRALWRQRPRIIQAYARSAVLFARFLRSQNLKPYRPLSLITTAEVLEDPDRDLLEGVFGCPVFNRYGCREVSVVASECTGHRGMHVMAEGLYVEVESQAGPAGPGQLGGILVTDLLNPAMPLIRYRIGDMGAWAAGPCPCGRTLPRLEKVSGRVTDFLVGCDGRLVSGVFLATYVVAQRPSLGQVQIHQRWAGSLTWKVRPASGFDPQADVEYLRRATSEHLGAKASADVELVEDFPASPSGKFLFSCSSVTPGFLTARAA